MNHSDCPCGAGPYETCCGVFHQGAPAPTAETLMRSRYSAFARGLPSYLALTHHPDTLTPESYSDLEGTRWVGLTILDTTGGGGLHDRGEVAFEARFIQKGRLGVLSERSDFVRVDGAWRYRSGTHLPTPAPVKVARNAACPCGSGKKAKRCCAL